MKKFNIGDEVTIREDLSTSMKVRCGVTSEMETFRGRKAKIVNEYGSYYELDVDNERWNWSLGMFLEFKIEITAILEKHLKWLRGEKEGERANLRGADLSDANLSDANLRGANLRGANLLCKGIAYKLNKIITVSNIGSRNDTTYIYITQCNNVIVRCGCFFNLIDEFEKAVKRTHEGSVYEQQYNAVITLAKTFVNSINE